MDRLDYRGKIPMHHRNAVYAESLMWKNHKDRVTEMPNEESEKLKEEIAQLRRAYGDLFNRITFTEKRVELNEDFVKQKQAEEIQVSIEKQHTFSKQHSFSGAELIPYAEDVAKLPAKYADKTFPYVTLPMLHTALFVKGIFRRLLSYVVPMDASHEGTKAALREAERERQLINIVRLQRQITRFQRILAKGVRKNQDSIVAAVGDYTTENMIIAYALKDHFSDTGQKEVVVTSSADEIWLHIEIYY